MEMFKFEFELDIESIINNISVKLLIKSKDKRLKPLIDDINILLKNPDSIKFIMGWDLEGRLIDWECIKIIDKRIRYINLEDNEFNSKDWKRLSLPSGLKILKLNTNNFGINDIKNLVLPSGLKKLSLSNNNIDNDFVKVLCKALPLKLKYLSLRYNIIGDEGVKGLVLPPGLKELHLENNNIGDEGAKGLILPPGLKKLNLGGNNIGNEGVKGLRLPPKLRKLSLKNLHIDKKIKILVKKRRKSPEGIKRYAPIKRYYDKIMSKPMQIEICRGLLYGETEDPIFRFLQKIHGSKNIIRNVLTSYNPFV